MSLLLVCVAVEVEVGDKADDVAHPEDVVQLAVVINPKVCVSVCLCVCVWVGIRSQNST